MVILSFLVCLALARQKEPFHLRVRMAASDRAGHRRCPLSVAVAQWAQRIAGPAIATGSAFTRARVGRPSTQLAPRGHWCSSRGSGSIADASYAVDGPPPRRPGRISGMSQPKSNRHRAPWNGIILSCAALACSGSRPHSRLPPVRRPARPGAPCRRQRLTGVERGRGRRGRRKPVEQRNQDVTRYGLRGDKPLVRDVDARLALDHLACDQQFFIDVG